MKLTHIQHKLHHLHRSALHRILFLTMDPGIQFPPCKHVPRLRELHQLVVEGNSPPVRSSRLDDPARFTLHKQELGDKDAIKNNDPHHDIAIIGGGMVGMALACSLASMPMTKHLNVAIIDSNPTIQREEYFKKDDPPDPRVSTVTPATISFFKDVGAWQYVEQHRHAYFDKMQVWDYTGLGYTRYNARDVDKEVLGCVVENRVLHRSLMSCMQNTDSQRTIYPSRLTSMTPSLLSMRVDGTSSGTSMSTSEGLAKLELTDGNSLYAKLVVGADGSKSRVRELAGFKTTGWKYSQNAIICTVEHPVDNYCAWQRFLPCGPIALLPIGDKFSNVVWTMDPKESSNCKSMCEEDFLHALNQALDSGYGPPPQLQFGDGSIFSWFRANVTSSATECFESPPKVLKLASERMVFPLSLMHANQYASRRVVLLGDAAHTVHPLAGQGVNLGFGDAAALSRTIAEGIEVGSDVGEASLLKKYEADRKLTNITMMALLDGFQKAYSVDFGPLNVLRAAAFHGAQYISPLKRSIILYASGKKNIVVFFHKHDKETQNFLLISVFLKLGMWVAGYHHCFTPSSEGLVFGLISTIQSPRQLSGETSYLFG